MPQFLNRKKDFKQTKHFPVDLFFFFLVGVPEAPQPIKVLSTMHGPNPFHEFEKIVHIVLATLVALITIIKKALQQPPGQGEWPTHPQLLLARACV